MQIGASLDPAAEARDRRLGHPTVIGVPPEEADSSPPTFSPGLPRPTSVLQLAQACLRWRR